MSATLKQPADLRVFVDALRTQVRHAPVTRRVGRVTGVTGLVIESDGPNVGLGELCRLNSDRGDFSVTAEVVGFRGERVLLMPLGETAGLHAGCEVTACDRPALPKPGPGLFGRVVDALGRPFDGLGAIPTQRGDASASNVPHPLRRQRIESIDLIKGDDVTAPIIMAITLEQFE